MQRETIRQPGGNINILFSLLLSSAFLAGCQSSWNPFSHARHAAPAPVPVATAPEPASSGPAPDQRTSMEAAADAAASSTTTAPATAAAAVPLAEGAPQTYVVRRGDTLWDISRTFLRDPWYWPEIWHANPQIENPHLIYPGDTLRLVYINGQPQVILERGGAAKVEPRVRSQPLEGAITAIPYEIVASFMSKPSVLSKEQIDAAPYVLASRDRHLIMAEGNTIYARGFSAPAENGARFNMIRVGERLRDPESNEVIGYAGVFSAAGRVTRAGDPTTLVLTESTRETLEGDRLLSSNVDVPLDFIPSSPKVKVAGAIIAVHDGVTMIGQYQVVVINRGASAGLAPGNVLAVYQLGESLRDRHAQGKVAKFGSLFADKVKLPDERTGTFMVFKTFDRISYGLIMEAKSTIRVLDRVENP
jgi:LysM repeat protein